MQTNWTHWQELLQIWIIIILYNSFFKEQLSYCPLIWTFCSRRSNHLINKLQERALRIAYNDFNPNFSELLEIANESTIHIRNLKCLLTEVYKFLNGLSPLTMNEVFQINDCPYDLQNPRLLASKHKTTIKYGIKKIAFRGPQIWQNIPLETRNSESLSLFKLNIKQIQSLPCRCKICRLFIANLGYIHSFFIRTSKFCLRLVFLNFSSFLKLKCS